MPIFLLRFPFLLKFGKDSNKFTRNAEDFFSFGFVVLRIIIVESQTPRQIVFGVFIHNHSVPKQFTHLLSLLCRFLPLIHFQNVVKLLTCVLNCVKNFWVKHYQRFFRTWFFSLFASFDNIYVKFFFNLNFNAEF